MIKIPKERWQAAQAWEREMWVSENKSPLKKLARTVLAKFGLHNFEGDDWNYWWQEKFDGYRVVPVELKNVIELGCGPYTNIRLVRAGRNIQHLICSDPLVKHYIRFKGRWLSEFWQNGEVLIDDHPAEDCPFATCYFDLTIMINVLDHVHDATQCIYHATRITKAGGLLVLGQDLTNSEDLSNPGVRDDVGHPIRLTHEMLDEELMPNFETVLYRVLPRAEGRNPAAHYGTYIFIGQKR